MSSAAAKSMATPPPPKTVADLLAADPDRSFELIDGELVEKQAGFRHGRAQVQLSRSVGAFDRPGGGEGGPGGWWILSEQLIRFSPSRVLKPDLAGWRRDRLPTPPPEDEDGIIDTRPDWVCEIVSPKHAANDMVRKRRLYLQYQVPHYWIIDPRDQSVLILQLGEQGYMELAVAQRGDILANAAPFGLDLVVADLFPDEA